MLARMYSRWLAVTATTYAVVHHLGLVPDGLGPGPEGTRWADWIDLVVPWLVLTPAAATLWAARVSVGTWAILGAGVIAYTSGHGIHLAANSVGNDVPGATAHLWDEVVGHYIWYAGVALVVAALGASMAGRPRPHAIGYLLALGVGATWATNAVGGGTVVFGLVLALAAAASGWTRRDELGVVLLVGALPAAIGLGVARVLGLG